MKVRQATHTDIGKILKLLSELGIPTAKTKIKEQKFSEIIKSFLSNITINNILLATVYNSDSYSETIVGMLSYVLIQNKGEYPRKNLQNF